MNLVRYYGEVVKDGPPEKHLEVIFNETRPEIPKYKDLRCGMMFKIHDHTLVYCSLIDELLMFPDTRYIKVVGIVERKHGDLVLFHLLDENMNELINKGVFDVNYTFLNKI